MTDDLEAKLRANRNAVMDELERIDAGMRTTVVITKALGYAETIGHAAGAAEERTKRWAAEDRARIAERLQGELIGWREGFEEELSLHNETKSKLATERARTLAEVVAWLRESACSPYGWGDTGPDIADAIESGAWQSGEEQSGRIGEGKR